MSKCLDWEEDVGEKDVDEFLYPLKHSYKIYLHNPQDSDWSIESYKLMCQFETVDEMVEIFRNLEAFRDKCPIKTGMLFVMKNDILPQWEHEDNVHGGSFCYKISKSLVCQTFKHLVFSMAGNCISADEGFVEDITGVTISPKLGDYCIIKIWTRGKKYQDPTIVNSNIGALKPHGCIFKSHS
jgi:hypothetical protein